jgi:hypothetical protein
MMKVSGKQEKAKILKAGRPEDIERYLRRPNGLEKKIREWAENLISIEQEALKNSGPQPPDKFLQNKKRDSDLDAEFKRIADPGFEGTVDAAKFICRHYLNRLIPQPA